MSWLKKMLISSALLCVCLPFYAMDTLNKDEEVFVDASETFDQGDIKRAIQNSLEEENNNGASSSSAIPGSVDQRAGSRSRSSSGVSVGSDFGVNNNGASSSSVGAQRERSLSRAARQRSLSVTVPPQEEVSLSQSLADAMKTPLENKESSVSREERQRSLSVVVPPTPGSLGYSVEELEMISSLPEKRITSINLKNFERSRRGALVARYVLGLLRKDDHFVVKEEQEAYLADIVDLMWFFYNEAVIKGQAFNEGAFVIEDTDLKFYKFLISYVKKFNNKVNDDPSRDKVAMGNADVIKQEIAKLIGKWSPTWLVQAEETNTFAYPRLSSHLTHLQFGHPEALALKCDGSYRHYGIDVPLDVDGKGQLPTDNKKHILFGKMGPHLLFIKFEDAGTGQDVLEHARSFINSILVKFSMKVQDAFAALIASSPLGVSSSAQKKIGSPMSTSGTLDDQPAYRKERIPQAFIKEGDRLIGESTLSKEFKKTFIVMIRLFGMRSLYYLVGDEQVNGEQRLMDLLSGLGKCKSESALSKVSVQKMQQAIKADKELLKKLKEFLEDIKNNYDNPGLRTGREVILTQEELRQFLNSRYQGSKKISIDPGIIQHIFGGRIRVYNDSTWRLVLIIKNKKEELWTVVLESKASVDVGARTEFSDDITIEYKSYGDLWSILGNFYSIQSKDLKKSVPNNKVRVIIINQNYSYNVEEKTARANPLPQDYAPCSVFSGLVFYTIKDCSVLTEDSARYVLGLPKGLGGKLLEKSRDRMSQRLLEEWNLSLYPGDEILVNKIRKIIEKSDFKLTPEIK